MTTSAEATRSCIQTLHYLYEKYAHLFEQPAGLAPTPSQDMVYAKRMTEEDKRKILALRSKGILMKEVAKIVGCSRSTVSKVCSGKKYQKRKLT